MKATTTWMCACAVLGAGLSAQAADGLIFRTARNVELAPPGEEEVLLSAPDAKPAPVQVPGSVLKGEAIEEAGPPQAEYGSGSACTDRRYFSWLTGGCCDRQPSCCDNVWDGYCAQRKQWCHKCQKAHGCAQGAPQPCPSCQTGKWAMAGYRHKGGCASCGCGAGLGMHHLGKHHHGGCSTCDSCGQGSSWTSWRPFGGYFESMWAGDSSGGCADCAAKSGYPAGANYPEGTPTYQPSSESILAPQPEPEMKEPMLKPEPMKERAAQQRPFLNLGLGIFQ